MMRTSLLVGVMVATAVGALSCASGKKPVVPVCGDGIVEGDEECDDGPANNDILPDSCRRLCTAPGCGDGVVDTGEQCDDGNVVAGDGCNASCVREPRCGDGFVDAGEQCDDGNDVSGDGCSDVCAWEFVCGDGTCESDRNETCPVCPEDCCPCGDGACDSAAGETCGMCQADCCPDCGNGVLDGAEECDDGNLADGDGCSAACIDEDGQADCGNGLLEAGEQCEDGNTADGDGCSAQCQLEFVCGDGTCESANGETCQLCQVDCCPNCGNGVIEAGEECDGADLGGQSCLDLCYAGGTLSCTAWCAINTAGCTGTLPSCGNGVAECGEECDGSDFGGQLCGDFGYGDGALACTTGCTVDPSGCGPLLTYYSEDFEGGCPSGWTLGGDWECGVPTSGPGSAYSGTHCLATILSGNHSDSLNWATCTADSPAFTIPAGTDPVLSFWSWLDSESGYDGANVKISTNGGGSFTQLTNVSPGYTGTIGGEQAWYGDFSGAGWREVTADLSGYAGQTVVLRFAFRSDSSVTNPGAYVDDVTVVDAMTIPLQITSTSPLPDVRVGDAYSQSLQRTGGSSAAQWSIVGGSNHAWLSIDPNSGVLSGTPAVGDAGPVSVTVRVEEPALTTNFAEATFALNVYDAIWAESFDSGCPAGWSLSGEWQCGSPSNGPGGAYDGANCLATLLHSDYSNYLDWSTCTATSPPISLVAATAPQLRFRLWIDTETSYDGANVKVSTNCSSYTLLTTSKAYNGTLDGESAWYGHESSSGWQEVTADLTPYVGQTICLRFAFRSDLSITYPGAFVDAVEVLD